MILRKSLTTKFRKDRVREPYTAEQQQQLMRDGRYKDKKVRAEHLAKGKYLRNIIRVPSLKGSSKEKCRHPSQKPLELIGALIACSRTGAISCWTLFSALALRLWLPRC